jgi:glycosyltransferase involved in cell wall biosynthesis
MNRRVVIVQEHLPAFRVPFYRQLKALLEQHSVGLELVYAPNQRNTFLKGELEWATPVPIRWLGPLGWQPVMGLVRGCDLVVVQQETKYAANPVLQALATFGGPPVAYWGHGKNFQAADRRGIGFRVKSGLSKRVHWWFAYNDLSAAVVRDLGYPSDRITSVGNAIDTRALIERRAALLDQELEGMRSTLGLRSSQVAVYTGGLYSNKRLEFLIEAVERIREQVTDFELIVIGDGPDRRIVTVAAARNHWIHDIGPKNDQQKVPYWALSKLLLMPGGVGLVVLDSFAFGVPMVTTETRLHGPEIDYLKSGENGLLVECGESVDAYADAVVALLREESRLERLRQGALASATEYTIEKMAGNFADGVMQALAAPRL